MNNRHWSAHSSGEPEPQLWVGFRQRVRDSAGPSAPGRLTRPVSVSAWPLPLSVCLWVFPFSSPMGRALDLGPTVIQDDLLLTLILITSVMSLFWNKVTFCGSGWIRIIFWWGGPHETHQRLHGTPYQHPPLPSPDVNISNLGPCRNPWHFVNCPPMRESTRKLEPDYVLMCWGKGRSWDLRKPANGLHLNQNL